MSRLLKLVLYLFVDDDGLNLQRYEITIEVVDAHNNESFTVREMKREGWAKHELSSHALNVSCIFNTHTSEGYLVEGKHLCVCLS